jgi:SAM-dependent methyltransferase
MPDVNDEQSRRWNGVAGRAWVDAQAALDQTYKPLEDLVVDAVSVRSRVLDVGCGTGGTTIAIARRLGAGGHSTGIDISAPMIAAARARAGGEGTPAEFICADAQLYPFEPASFDAIVSRFGVMFFQDPVAAFSNLRRGATDGAALTFIAWRSPGENPFMTTAERAAAPLLPDLPVRRADGPGQFAFENRDRVYRILDGSGWTGIDVQPIDVECTFEAQELVTYLSRMGPVGLALQQADERLRARVIEVVRPAFDPYVHGAEVRFTAACWMVCAGAPS